MRGPGLSLLQFSSLQGSLFRVGSFGTPPGVHTISIEAPPPTPLMALVSLQIVPGTPFWDFPGDNRAANGYR